MHGPTNVKFSIINFYAVDHRYFPDDYQITVSSLTQNILGAKNIIVMFISVHGHTAEFRRVRNSWPVPVAERAKV